MNRWFAALPFALCILLVAPFAFAIQVNPENRVYALPEMNGYVILGPGASYDADGATYLISNYTGNHVWAGKIYVWYFPMFSMGNGTTMLRASAQDCNFTITALNTTSTPIGNDQYNRTKTIHCIVAGDGEARIDMGAFSNQTVIVYRDGVLKQEMDGWMQDDFGVSLTEASSDIVIYSQFVDVVSPNNFDQFNDLTYAGVIIGLIIGILIVVTMTELKGYRHKQKTENKN
jgi:hypothetical protein